MLVLFQVHLLSPITITVSVIGFYPYWTDEKLRLKAQVICPRSLIEWVRGDAKILTASLTPDLFTAGLLVHSSDLSLTVKVSLPSYAAAQKPFPPNKQISGILNLVAAVNLLQFLKHKLFIILAISESSRESSKSVSNQI